MDESLKHRVDALLEEAELAINPKTNGLLAHTDCNHVIAKFIVTTRRIVRAHEDLQRERDELSTRLERSARFNFLPPATSHAPDAVQ